MNLFENLQHLKESNTINNINDIKKFISNNLKLISDQAFANVLREIIFQSDIEWKDVQNIITRYMPEVKINDIIKNENISLKTIMESGRPKFKTDVVCPNCNKTVNISANQVCPNCDSSESLTDLVVNNVSAANKKYSLIINASTGLIGLGNYYIPTTKTPSDSADVKNVTKEFYEHLAKSYPLIKDDVPKDALAGAIKINDLSDEDKIIINSL